MGFWILHQCIFSGIQTVVVVSVTLPAPVCSNPAGVIVSNQNFRAASGGFTSDWQGLHHLLKRDTWGRKGHEKAL